MDATQAIEQIQDRIIYWLSSNCLYVISELENLTDKELYEIFDAEYYI